MEIIGQNNIDKLYIEMDQAGIGINKRSELYSSIEPLRFEI